MQRTNQTNNTSWLSRPEFASMEPMKKKILSDFILSIQNKSIPQAIPLLMHTKETLEKNHLSFTKAESALIFEVLSVKLGPAEREMLQRFL